MFWIKKPSNSRQANPMVFFSHNSNLNTSIPWTVKAHKKIKQTNIEPDKGYQKWECAIPFIVLWKSLLNSLTDYLIIDKETSSGQADNHEVYYDTNDSSPKEIEADTEEWQNEFSQIAENQPQQRHADDLHKGARYLDDPPAIDKGCCHGDSKG